MPFKVTTHGGKRIDGLEQLMGQLKDLQTESRRDNNRRLAVGYLAFYAIYVHERLDVYHAPPTMAKWLETTYRRVAGRMAKIIYAVLRTQSRGKGGRYVAGGTNKMAQALVAAGDYLIREANAICPIDTGYLRRSAFVRLDKTKG